MVRVGGGKGALRRSVGAHRSISVIAWTTSTTPATTLVVGAVVAPVGRLVVWLQPLSGLGHHANVEVAGHWVARYCRSWLQQAPGRQPIGCHLRLAGGQEDMVGLGGPGAPCHVACARLRWPLYQCVARVWG